MRVVADEAGLRLAVEESVDGQARWFVLAARDWDRVTGEPHDWARVATGPWGGGEAAVRDGSFVFRCLQRGARVEHATIA